MSARSNDSFEIAIRKFEQQNGHENFPKLGSK
jgi:hypothetical protein